MTCIPHIMGVSLFILSRSRGPLSLNPNHRIPPKKVPGTSTKESAKRMNSALALRSSGVAMATKVMICSEPNLGDGEL